MSFLLDALRKSESQKHLGQTPTIHSSSVLETRTSANRRLGLVLVVLLPVLLVLAWYGLKDLLPGSSVVEQGSQEPAVSSPGSPASLTDSTATSDQPLLPEIPTAASDKTQLNASRTPVETYTESAVVSSQPESGAFQNEPVPERIAATDTSRQESQDETSTQLLSVPAAPVQSDSPATLQETAVISYWQLPDSVRGQLVAIRISVMVYSEKPEERFIIMNGKRLVEGDEPQAGLVLKEIRREGAVFSFRLYRFLVKR